MSDFIDGTIQGWPCNIMVQHDAGGRAYGIQCAAYTNENGESAPDDIQAIIDEIEWEGKPGALLKKAKALGFVPDTTMESERDNSNLSQGCLASGLEGPDCTNSLCQQRCGASIPEFV